MTGGVTLAMTCDRGNLCALCGSWVENRRLGCLGRGQEAVQFRRCQLWMLLYPAVSKVVNERHRVRQAWCRLAWR